MGRKSRARELAVWVNGAHVGAWRIPTRGEEEFQYDEAWTLSEDARPLSLSLAFNLDNSPIRGQVVHNYFDNLLPDSDPIRQRIRQKFNTRTQQAFDLLVAIGRDCVGAVQLLPPDEPPDDIRKIDVEPLTDQQIEAALIQQTTYSAPRAGLDAADFRISIAGAQEKSAFTLHDGKWCKPLGATPTTHIFKLPLGRIGNVQADLRDSVENEWLCSKILAAYGLPTASTDMAVFGNQKTLIVERFDRQLDPTNKYWLRLVQEDICQALGEPSSRKYEQAGGPGIIEICELLRGSINRDADLKTFFKAQIIFWLLAAGDGHAKNFSIRILDQGRYHLTPLYDVLSYWPIAGRGPNLIQPQDLVMAMSIRGKNKHYKHGEILRRHFNQTAARSGVGESAEELIAEILRDTPAVMKSVGAVVPKEFPQVVLERTLSGLERSAAALASMPA